MRVSAAITTITLYKSFMSLRPPCCTGPVQPFIYTEERNDTQGNPVPQDISVLRPDKDLHPYLSPH